MRIDLRHDSIWFDVIGEKERRADGRRIVKPTLVFVHGGGGNHSSARPLAGELADLAQCIVLDLPGHGRSSIHAQDRWTLDSWADTLAELVRTLGIDRPIFHGGSMGGFIVQTLAVRHPGLAGGLVLAATAARRDKILVEARFHELGGPEAAAAYRQSNEEPASPKVFERFVHHCLPLYSTKLKTNTAAHLAGFEVFGKNERQTLAWFSRPGGDFDTFDLRGALKNVTEPTLIIGGAKDPVIPQAAVEEMYASFAPGVANLEMLEDASHLVTVDEHDKYVQLVRDFITNTSRGSHMY